MRKLVAMCLLITANVASAAGLQIDLGDAWLPQQEGTTLHFERRSPRAKLLLTPLPGAPADDAALRRIVEKAREPVTHSAVEKKLAIVPFPGRHGALFCATDSTWTAAKVDEFPAMCQGALSVDGVVVVFTALADDKNGEPMQQALRALHDAKFEHATFATIHVGPVQLDLPPLTTQHRDEGAGGPTFSGNAGRTNVSVFVEPPHAKGEPFDFYWPLSRKNPLIIGDSVQVTRTAERVRVDYDVSAPVEGEPIRQRNVNYFFAFGGRWFDVHVSVIDPRPEDDEIFSTLDRTLRVQ